MRLARRPDRIPNGGRTVRMAPDLVAQLARIAGPRYDHGRAGNPSDRETKPAELREGGLMRCRAHDRGQNVTRAGTLNCEVMQLIGR